jgi:hypothetical protein
MVAVHLQLAMSGFYKQWPDWSFANNKLKSLTKRDNLEFIKGILKVWKINGVSHKRFQKAGLFSTC